MQTNVMITHRKAEELTSNKCYLDEISIEPLCSPGMLRNRWHHIVCVCVYRISLSISGALNDVNLRLKL